MSEAELPFSVESLIRPSLLGLNPYSSARSLTSADASLIYLDANECPRQEDSGTDSLPYNRYPNPQSPELLKALAEEYRVSSENLVCLRGSDEAIDLLIRLFCESGKDRILITPPTYGMYSVSAAIQGAEVLSVPLIPVRSSETSTWKLDEAGILEALERNEGRLKIIFLCSPNNPTGTLFSRESILRILDGAQEKRDCITDGSKVGSKVGSAAIVVIDEAYLEYSTSQGFSTELERYPNLVVLRTFSKARALAGVRFGVAIAEKKVIDWLNRVRAPYPLPLPTQEIVLKSLRAEERERLEKRIQTTVSERERIVEILSRHPAVLRIENSVTNFILIRFKESSRLMSNLKAAGIIVRSRVNEEALEGCLRITIGTRSENDAWLKVLEQLNSNA